jgi:hypothetical protein
VGRSRKRRRPSAAPVDHLWGARPPERSASPGRRLIAALPSDRLRDFTESAALIGAVLAAEESSPKSYRSPSDRGDATSSPLGRRRRTCCSRCRPWRSRSRSSGRCRRSGPRRPSSSCSSSGTTCASTVAGPAPISSPPRSPGAPRGRVMRGLAMAGALIRQRRARRLAAASVPARGLVTAIACQLVRCSFASLVPAPRPRAARGRDSRPRCGSSMTTASSVGSLIANVARRRRSRGLHVRRPHRRRPGRV